MIEWFQLWVCFAVVALRSVRRACCRSPVHHRHFARARQWAQGSDGPRQFTVERNGDSSGMPRNRTSFNRLDLPQYEDHESLGRKLRFA